MPHLECINTSESTTRAPETNTPQPSFCVVGMFSGDVITYSCARINAVACSFRLKCGSLHPPWIRNHINLQYQIYQVKFNLKNILFYELKFIRILSGFRFPTCLKRKRQMIISGMHRTSEYTNNDVWSILFLCDRWQRIKNLFLFV